MRTRAAIVTRKIIAGLIILHVTCVAAVTAGPRELQGIETLYRLDLLPKVKPFSNIGCFSSYDPTGGNDDGFSGKHSFIRKEGNDFVIAEMEGPGVITRFHMSKPTSGIIKFYFDGEISPRIRMTIDEMFGGTRAPFWPPLIGTEAGGRYSYVPLAFEKSCKIAIETNIVHFFQINYARYPKDAMVTTYQDPPSETFVDCLNKVRDVFRSAGSNISSHLVSEGTPVETKTRRETLGPGESVTLFETDCPGRIVGLKLSPAAAFAGHERDIVIRMYWDGASTPAVSCPVSDFFGYSFGEPAIRSLLLGTTGGVDYIYMPMPFEKSARIELVSERMSGPAFEVQADVMLAPAGKATDEGRFYAHWHRENPTRIGEPFTFLQTTGQGHIVGVILQAQGLRGGHTSFFEGDDLAVIDGRIVARGTGSEETFNGGWYEVPGRWEDRVSLPLTGCLDYKKYLGRTGGYRWMIADTYPYRESIDFNIEHGPEGNKILTDYTSVTYFYSLEPPSIDSSLPQVADRKVSAPGRIVFVPGWNVPVRTFSLQNATLAKKVATVGDRPIRHLEFRVTGQDIFGPHHVAFICDVPTDGRYKVELKAILGPDQGIVQVYRHDSPVGRQVNLYAQEQCVSDYLALGTFDMLEGDNPVFLVLVGKDERSTGLGLDAVELIFERVE